MPYLLCVLRFACRGCPHLRIAGRLAYAVPLPLLWAAICVPPAAAAQDSLLDCLPSVQHDKLVLGEPLSDCSLFEAALFLRLCYRPQDVSPANLVAQRASLPALLRLAHKLDAGRILGEVAKHMKGG